MLERLGATAVCVMNVSGDDPLGMLRSYGADVLPALRAPEPGVTESAAYPLLLT